jgi:hypothetical protein
LGVKPHYFQEIPPVRHSRCGTKTIPGASRWMIAELFHLFFRYINQEKIPEKKIWLTSFSHSGVFF